MLWHLGGVKVFLGLLSPALVCTLRGWEAEIPCARHLLLPRSLWQSLVAEKKNTVCQGVSHCWSLVWVSDVGTVSGDRDGVDLEGPLTHFFGAFVRKAQSSGAGLRP